MKFLSIAIKDTKELLRDKRGLFFILLFPLIFMVVFGFAFGGMGQSNTSYNLAIVNYDQGATLSFTNQSTNFGNNLTQNLKDVKYENSDVHMFNITEISENEANDLLKQRKIDALLVIPPNFSQAVVALMNSTIQTSTNPLSSTSNSTHITSTLIIRGDPGYMNFGVTQGILAGILSKYQDEVVTQTLNNVKGTPGAQEVRYINSTVEPIAGTQDYTTFDFIAPGMIVFAILLLATTVAANLTREAENGTLARLKLSKMRGFDLLFGGMIPWSMVAAVQVIILLTVAILMGFHWQGGANSIVLAIIVGIIGGIASISLGMIIAAFAQNDRQAANLGTLIVVPASFLVGAFFPLPNVDILGHQFNEFLPWTHILNALRATLTYGGGWDAISYQVAASVFLTIILFIIGLLLFSRNRLQAEN